MPNRVVSTDWIFPEEGKTLDVGMLDTDNGKFIGLILCGHKYAISADVAIRVAKIMAWAGLEIQGKVPAETAPDGKLLN